jgi:RimJ/RimL family protein N-acetyltransferase
LDAAALLGLKRRLDQETSFMMYEPGERDLHRLELTVMAHNSRAIRLYKRMG